MSRALPVHAAAARSRAAPLGPADTPRGPRPAPALHRYHDALRGDDSARIADALLRLRAALRASIPAKILSASILLATWNIRDFGRQRLGPRTPEALAYIAEILASFDLVAVQEVNDDLAELEHVCDLLGPHWSRIYTDTTDGQAGNGERLAFLFDTRNVRPLPSGGSCRATTVSRECAVSGQPRRANRAILGRLLRAPSFARPCTPCSFFLVDRASICWIVLLTRAAHEERKSLQTARSLGDVA